MNLSRFIALRIYRNSEPGKQVSRPAVLIAMVGIALGLAVMIIAVSVIVGFKSEVRDKIVGFGAHIQIGNLDAARSYETRPVVVGDSMMAALSDYRSEACTTLLHQAGDDKDRRCLSGMVLKVWGRSMTAPFSTAICWRGVSAIQRFRFVQPRSHLKVSCQQAAIETW